MQADVDLCGAYFELQEKHEDMNAIARLLQVRPWLRPAPESRVLTDPSTTELARIDEADQRDTLEKTVLPGRSLHGD